MEENELKVRPITPDDLGKVASIQEAIIQRKVIPGWENLLKVNMAKPDGIFLAAEVNGEVVGFFLGEVKHGHFGLEHSGWIEMFGVDPKIMGRGVGRALAQTALQHFKEQGVTEIYTAVRWDSGDLLAFFKDIGFSLSDFINLKAKLD